VLDADEVDTCNGGYKVYTRREIEMPMNKNPVGRPPVFDGCTSNLHIKVKPSDKAAWVKAAQGHGGLSAWVKRVLNKAREEVE
jgi:hypothetical protein